MSTWSNQQKNNGALGANKFLLKEDGGFLLLESGGKIVLNLGSDDTLWVNQLKNIGGGAGFLLKEDGFFLLLESGGKIIINNSAPATWTNQIKN